MEKKLNLGCGQFPKTGFVNVDIDPNSKADIICDLRQVPYPFLDESFDLIEIDHVLEHLTNTLDVMSELRRILRSGGTLVIKTPHFTRGFTHYDHKRGFDVTFPYYFDPKFPGGYTGIHFENISTKLKWFGQDHLKRRTLPALSYHTGKYLGMFFDFIGNLNLFFTSRLFAFWVGGYDEVVFVFRRPPPR